MSKPYILCVDDDKSILLSLKLQLQHYLGSQFNFEIAQSASEAWEIIDDLYDQGERITVIISDYIMPIVKGDEFLISVHLKHPDICKIILTGHADQRAIENLKSDINLSGFFGKPWDIEKLIDNIMSNPLASSLAESHPSTSSAPNAD